MLALYSWSSSMEWKHSILGTAGNEGTCVTDCLSVPANSESLGEREEWKDDSEDIVGRDTPTDHESLERVEPQVRVCYVLCVCNLYLSLERLTSTCIHATMQLS